jgi:endogenous inhibitor of DNA gyrase (YacG/DUF329 family)
MNRRELTEEIKALRIQYEREKRNGDTKQLAKIEAMGKELREQIKNKPEGSCYNCGEYDMVDPYLPFCQAKCHTEWAEENYIEKPKEKRKLTIREMQQQLLEMKKRDLLKK